MARTEDLEADLCGSQLGGNTHTHTQMKRQALTLNWEQTNKQTTQNSKRNYGEQNSVFK